MNQANKWLDSWPRVIDHRRRYQHILDIIDAPEETRRSESRDECGRGQGEAPSGGITGIWYCCYCHLRPGRAYFIGKLRVLWVLYVFPVPMDRQISTPKTLVRTQINADKLWREKTDICVYASERCRGHVAWIDLHFDLNLTRMRFIILFAMVQSV